MARPVLLDTNLAVLFVVGLLGPRHIERHPRLSRYDRADFDLLKELLSVSAGVVVTPNVLTETSNLCRQTSEPLRTQVSKALAVLMGEWTEIHVESRSLGESAFHLRLGLTDAALLSLAGPDRALLTDDELLYRAALSNGAEALNFSHLRAARR